MALKVGFYLKWNLKKLKGFNIKIRHIWRHPWPQMEPLGVFLSRFLRNFEVPQWSWIASLLSGMARHSRPIFSISCLRLVISFFSKEPWLFIGSPSEVPHCLQTHFFNSTHLAFILFSSKDYFIIITLRIMPSKYHFPINGFLEREKKKKKDWRTTYKFWVKTDREYQYQNNEYSQKDLKWDIKSLFQNANSLKFKAIL